MNILTSVVGVAAVAGTCAVGACAESEQGTPSEPKATTAEAPAPAEAHAQHARDLKPVPLPPVDLGAPQRKRPADPSDSSDR